MSIDRNPLNITDPNVRRLSEFVFKHYHTNPTNNGHSRVSDAFAKAIADGPPELTMELATILAHIAGAPTGHEVTAFAMAPKRTEPDLPDWFTDMMKGDHPKVTMKEGDPGPMTSLEEMLGAMGFVAIRLDMPDDEQELYDGDLIDSDDDIDPTVLWARAWQKLGGDEADVSFDHGYTPANATYEVPAIHGPNVTPMLVNGAIIEVLDEANLMDRLDDAVFYMADTMDDHGWVYQVEH